MICFNKPTLKRRDMDSVLQTMVNEQIGPGERCNFFTGVFSDITGCRSSVAYRTYPDCIEAALRFAGAQNGTVVAVSALTPIIYKVVAEKIGCVLAVLDVDRENALPSEEDVASSGAEIFVLYENCGTMPLRYNKDTTFADKNDYSNLKVIEDVTESIGAHLGTDAKPGDWGKIVVCAFEDDCVASCGGGAVLGVKEDYYNILRNNKPSRYVGLPDLNASLGYVQLSNLEENTAKRREIVKSYMSSLAKTPHKSFGFNMLDFSPSASTFCVFLNTKPDETIKFANKREIPVVMTFENSIIKECDGDLFEKYPVSAAYYYRTVSFPVYPFMTSKDIDEVSKVISHLP